jgi:hypothetical protein
MESIKVRQYKNDPRSFFTHLGSARAKEVAFQHTEKTLTSSCWTSSSKLLWMTTALLSS